jgi:putative transposase
MKRKRYSSEFKAKLALEVVKEQRTLNEIACDSGVHPTQLLQWKKQLLENLPSMFADKRCKAQQEQAAHEAQLYQEIGQLKVELDCAQGAPEKKAGLLTGR